MTAITTIKQQYLGKRSFVRPSGDAFWHFLDKNSLGYTKEDFPFLSRHDVPQIKAMFDFDQYLNQKAKGDALSYLYHGLGKALNYVGAVLDLERPHGFNDHSDTHTLWVTQQGIELLQQAGSSYDGSSYFDTTTEVMMTLIGMTHDIGNFLSRSEHSQYSAWMLARLFSNTYLRPREWQHVMYAILFHEEPVLIQSEAKLKDGFPLQWALVAADKMHVGRDRIGLRSFLSGVEQAVLEEDQHVLLNALIARSTWYLEPKSFVWHLSFTVDQLQEKFGPLGKHSNRIWVPDSFHTAFEQDHKLYRESYAELFTQLYGQRINMAAEAVFLLFPWVKRFEVKLTDNDTRGKVGSGQLSVVSIHKS